uniref:RRM domain-containing protein n=1 Tax=Strongyloides venezuelensis TaxID=75913 RepID=A0A0K0F0D6_STRVS
MVIGCSASKIFASSQQSQRNKSINSPLHWSKSYSPEKSVGLSPTSDSLHKSNKSIFEVSPSMSSENKSHKMRHRKRSPERREEKITTTRHLLIFAPKDSLNSTSKVEKFFSKYGYIEEVKKLDKRGQYIVSFEDIECAEKVFEKRKLDYNGEDIEVEYCYPEKSYTSSPALLSEININGKANGYEEFESNNESKRNDHHSKSRVHRSTSNSPKNAESHRNVLKDKSHNKLSNSENIPTTSKIIDNESLTPQSQDSESINRMMKGILREDVKELYTMTPVLKTYKYADIFCHSASRILYVTFPYSTIIDNEVKRQFLQFGAILDISVVKFPNNAYALIEYESMRAVAEVIEFFNEYFGKKQSDICKKYEPFKISLSKANWGRHLISNILWLEFLPSGTTLKYLTTKLKEVFKETIIDVHFHGINREAVVVFDSNESATNAFNAFKQSNIILNPSNKEGFVRTACDYSSSKNLERFIISVNKLHNTLKEVDDIVIGSDENLITFNLIQVTLPTEQQQPPIDTTITTESYPISSEEEEILTVIVKKEIKESLSVSPCITSSPVSSMEDSELIKKDKYKKISPTTKSITSKNEDKKSEKSQKLLKRKLSKSSDNEGQPDYYSKEYKKSIKKCKIIGGAVPVSPVSRSSKDNTPKPCTSDSEEGSVISSRSRHSTSRHERKSKSKRREQKNSYDKHISSSHVSNVSLSSQYFGESSRIHYETSSSGRRRRHYNDPPHHNDFGRHRDYGSYKMLRDDYRSYDRKDNNDRSSSYKDDKKHCRDDRGESHEKEQSKNQDDKNKKRDKKSKKHKKTRERHHIRDSDKEIQDHKKSHDHSKNSASSRSSSSSGKLCDKHLNNKNHDTTSNILNEQYNDKVTKSHTITTMKEDKRLLPIGKSHHHIKDKCKENVKSDKIKVSSKKGGQTSISGAEEISDTDEEVQNIIDRGKDVPLLKNDEKIDRTPMDECEKKGEDKELDDCSLKNFNDDIPQPIEGSPSISKDSGNQSSSETPLNVYYSDEIEPTHVHPFTADKLLTDCMNIANKEEKQYAIPNFISPTSTSDSVHENQDIIDEDNNAEFVHDIIEDDVSEDIVKQEYTKIDSVDVDETQLIPLEVEIHDEFGYLIYKGKKTEKSMNYVELPPLSPIPEYQLSRECEEIYSKIKQELENEYEYKNNTYELKINNKGIRKVDMNPNSRYNPEEVSELLRGREAKYEGTLDNLDGIEEIHDNEEEVCEENGVEEAEQLNPDGTKKKNTLPRFHPIKNKALAFKMYGKFISDSSAYRHKFITFMNTFSDLFNDDHDDINIYEDEDDDSHNYPPSFICNFNNLYDVDSNDVSDEEDDNEEEDDDISVTSNINDNIIVIGNDTFVDVEKINNEIVVDSCDGAVSEEMKNEQIIENDIFEEDIYKNIQMEEDYLNESIINDNDNNCSMNLPNNEVSEKEQQEMIKKEFSGYDIEDTENQIRDKEVMDVDKELKCISSSEFNEENESVLSDFQENFFKKPTYSTNIIDLVDVYQSLINESSDEVIKSDEKLQEISGNNSEKLTLVYPHYFNSKQFSNTLGVKSENWKISKIGIASNNTVISILQGDVEYKYIDENNDIHQVLNNEIEQYYNNSVQIGNDDGSSNLQNDIDEAQNRVSKCGYVKYYNNEELENYISGSERDSSSSHERYYSNSNDKSYPSVYGLPDGSVNDRYYLYSSEENSQETSCGEEKEGNEIYHNIRDYLVKEKSHMNVDDNQLMNSEPIDEIISNDHGEEFNDSIKNYGEDIINSNGEECDKKLCEGNGNIGDEQQYNDVSMDLEVKEECDFNEVTSNNDNIDYNRMNTNEEKYKDCEVNDDKTHNENIKETDYGSDDETNQSSQDEEINSNGYDAYNNSSYESNESNDDYDEEHHLPTIVGIQVPPNVFISNVGVNIGLALNTVSNEFDDCKECDGTEIDIPSLDDYNEEDENNDNTSVYDNNDMIVGNDNEIKEVKDNEVEELEGEEGDNDDEEEEPDDKILLSNHVEEINDVMDDRNLISLLQNTFKRNYDGFGDDILYKEPLYKRKKLEIIPAPHSVIEIEDIVNDDGGNTSSVFVKNHNLIEDYGVDDKEGDSEIDSITSSEYHTSDLEYLSTEENIFNFDIQYLESRGMTFENTAPTGDTFYETPSYDDNSSNSLDCNDSQYNLHLSSTMDKSNDVSPNEVDGMEVETEDKKMSIDRTMYKNTNVTECMTRETTAELSNNILIPLLATFTTKSANINKFTEVPIDKKCIKRYCIKTRLEMDDSDTEEVNYENHEIYIKDINHMEELKKSNNVVEDNEVISGDGLIRQRRNDDLNEYLARKQRVVANYENSTVLPINNDDDKNEDSNKVQLVEGNVNVNEEINKKDVIANNNLVAKGSGNICNLVSKKESNLEQMLIVEAPDKEAIEALNSLSYLDEREINEESIDDTSFLLDDIENPSDFGDSIGSELLEDDVEKLLNDEPTSQKKIKTEYVEKSNINNDTLINGYCDKEKIPSSESNEKDNIIKEPEMKVDEIEVKEECIGVEKDNDIIIIDGEVRENEKENMVVEVMEKKDEKNKMIEGEEIKFSEDTLTIKTDLLSSSIIEPLINNINDNVLLSSLKNTITENEENVVECEIENNKTQEKNECSGKENIIIQQNGYTSLPLSDKGNNYKLYVNTFGITFVNGTVLFELANANCLTSCPRICLQLKKWLCKLNLFYISGMKEILNDFIVTHTHPNRLNPKNRNIRISKKIVSKEYYEDIKKTLLYSSPNVLNLICGASGYNKEDYEIEETRLNNILNYCKKTGLYSGLLWQNAVSDYVAFFIPSCDILDDQFKSAQPQAFCKVKTGSMSYFYISIAPANLFRSGSS